MDYRKDFDDIFQEYVVGIKQFEILSKSDPLYTLEIALGLNRASRGNFWYRKHAFSALREIKPTKIVEISWLHFISHQKTMQELILDIVSKEVNWDIRLAAAEVLTAWGTQEVKLILDVCEIRDLPIEYYSRARILKGALEGIPGYMDWV